jgi:hypothetical protein
MALSKIVENSITDGVVSSAKLKDFSAAVDLNGVELILDDDQDTSITADTDDRIDFKIANTDHISIGTSSGDTVIKTMTDAKDIIFQQFDGKKLLEINDGGFVSLGNGASSGGVLRIYEDTDLGTNYSGFTVGNLTESYTLALPNADGSSGQALTTDGSGVLSFTTISSAADDLTIGDAAVLLTTSAGNITIDAAGNDTDIIFKGTDGGSDRVFMTIDGSAGGDLFLTGGLIDLKNDGSNVSQIKFYCESSNAHAQTLIGAPHSESATNTLTLPSTGGNSYLLTAASTATVTNKTLTSPKINEDVAVTTTATEINLIDGGTSRGTDAVASGDGILINDAGTMKMTNVDTVSTYFASHSVGGGNIVTTGALGSGSIAAGFGAIDNGTSGIRTNTFTAETAFVPDAQDGAALGTTSLQFSDLFLADGAVVGFGDDNEVTLTHVHDTGLLLSSTDQLQFGDAGTYIHQSADGVLDLVSDTEIEINATTIDINGNVEISGTATTTGVHTFTAVPVFPNNTIETADIQADAITGAKIADDAINSEHYTDASIDPAHLSDGVVETDKINNDAVTGAKIADNAINSEHYTDGSIDTAHIADSQVTLAKTTGLVGKQSIWVPSNAMTPTTTNGCAAILAVETTSGRPDMMVLDFDKDSDEFAQFSVAFPKSWNAGTITFQFFWSGIAATTGVAMNLQGVSFADNDSIDTVYGTAVVVQDDAQGAVEELLVSAESGAVTIAGSPGDNELCYFRVGRDISDGNDDMAGDCRLHGIKLFFTTDALTDA